MKRVYTLVLAFLMVFFAATTYATTHNVIVSDTAFIPINFSAQVGDTVVWTFSSGNVYQNNTASDTIPYGATSWGSGPENGGGPDFTYVITLPGTYRYESTTYYPFVGGFTVAPVAHHIIITDTAFLPDSFVVSVGDTIIWQAAVANANSNNTTASYLPRYAANWNSGSLAPGQTFTYLAMAPGNYNYQSDIKNTFSGNFMVLGNYTRYVIITDTAFIPDYFTANVGDTIIWLAASSNKLLDNTTSDTIAYSIPVYADQWSSGGLAAGDSFSYVIVYPGTYEYESDTNNNTFHGKFQVGNVITTGTGISQISYQPAGLIFQNPFRGHLNVISAQPGLLTIYDMLGNKLVDKQLALANHTVQIDMSGFCSGVYLVALSVDGRVVQIYKAVKVN